MGFYLPINCRISAINSVIFQVYENTLERHPPTIGLLASLTPIGTFSAGQGLSVMRNTGRALPQRQSRKILGASKIVPSLSAHSQAIQKISQTLSFIWRGFHPIFLQYISIALLTLHWPEIEVNPSPSKSLPPFVGAHGS